MPQILSPQSASQSAMWATAPAQLAQALSQYQQMSQNQQMFPEQLKAKHLANILAEKQLPYAGSKNWADIMSKIGYANLMLSPSTLMKNLPESAKTLVAPQLIKQLQQQIQQNPMLALSLKSQEMGIPIPSNMQPVLDSFNKKIESMKQQQQQMQKDNVSTPTPQTVGAPVSTQDQSEDLTTPRTDKQISDYYRAKQQKETTNANMQQQAERAQAMKSQLDKLPVDALKYYAGIKGRGREFWDKAKSIGQQLGMDVKPSEQFYPYEQYKEQTGKQIVDTIRQALGTSVRKSYVDALIGPLAQMDNPVWNNPELVARRINAIQDWANEYSGMLTDSLRRGVNLTDAQVKASINKYMPKSFDTKVHTSPGQSNKIPDIASWSDEKLNQEIEKAKKQLQKGKR